MTAARSSLSGSIARHPIVAYIVIAYAVSWVLTFLLSISLVFGLLALFGPALAAIVVTRAEGSFAELRARITAWRRPIGWYVLAFGIPFVVAAIARVILMATGSAPSGLGAISVIELMLFVLVIGEEIGWRGFLQPRFRARLGLVAAGVATGLVWTFWHLALYASLGLVPFLQFGWWAVSLAVVMGVVAEGTRYSVIVATVMHGAANIAIPILLPNVDRGWWLIIIGAIYWAVAIALILLARTRPAGKLLPG